MKIKTGPNAKEVSLAQHKFTRLTVVCGTQIGPHAQIGCGAEIEIDTGDMFTKQVGPSAMEQTSAHWWCPCCHNVQLLPPQVVPSNVVLPTHEGYLAERFTAYKKELLELYADNKKARKKINKEFPDLIN